jgi:chromosome segregation ATPase
MRNDVVRSKERRELLRQQYIQCDADYVASRGERSLLFESTMKGLLNLMRQQAEEVDKYITFHNRRLGEDNARIAAEEERVTMEQSGVAREEAALEEEKREIEQVILSQTVEVSKEKEGIDMKLMGLTAEIRNLEKLLAEKKQLEKELKTQLSVVEDKISTVRMKYDRRLQRIHDRVMDLTGDGEACKKEQAVIRTQRQAYNDDRTVVTHTEREVELWLSTMKSEVDIATSMKSALEELNPFNASTGSVESSLSVAPLKERVAECHSELNQSTSTLQEIQNSIAALVSEDQDISEKLPILEAEKKAHATAKRFKEAGNVAKTLKSLTTRKEEIVELMQRYETEVVECEKLITSSQSALEVAREELKAAEKTADIIRFNELLIQAKKVKKCHRKALRDREKCHQRHHLHYTAPCNPDARLTQVALDLLQEELNV